MDQAGKTVFHSGFIRPDGMLDERAHVYKQIILDERARPITRHQIWLTNIKAYDNTILPGRSDVVRFRLPALDGAVTLRARVNYRRLKFFAAHPQWADERIGAHIHGSHSAHRPVVTGTLAAPER